MRTNDVADRTLYAFRTWPVTSCARCKRDSIVKPDEHFCAVGVQCRDGCGQLVSLRGDGAVVAWSTGLTHACPPIQTGVAHDDYADLRAVDAEDIAPRKRRSLSATLGMAQEA